MSLADGEHRRATAMTATSSQSVNGDVVLVKGSGLFPGVFCHAAIVKYDGSSALFSIGPDGDNGVWWNSRSRLKAVQPRKRAAGRHVATEFESQADCRRLRPQSTGKALQLDLRRQMANRCLLLQPVVLGGLLPSLAMVLQAGYRRRPG